MDVQNTVDMSNPRPKQNRRPEPLKHTKDLGVQQLRFFSAP